VARVLLVGLPEEDGKKVEKIFKSVKLDVIKSDSFESAQDRIVNDPPALVVTKQTSDNALISNLHAVLKNRAPLTNMIAIINSKKLNYALEAMKAGAFDCVSKPYSRFDMLATAKCAAAVHRRSLFQTKLTQPRHPLTPVIKWLTGVCVLAGIIFQIYMGPPPYTHSLGSAHLTGLQWEGRQLWVGDWYDSNILRYKVLPGFFKKSRKFMANGVWKMSEGLPMVLCRTPHTLFSIGADLKIRSHYLSVGLPTIHATPTPGNRPTGLAWDGSHLWSSDQSTSLLYRHGEDLRVLDTIKSIVKEPKSMTFDGKSLWIVGDSPLKLAQLQLKSGGFVWRGPFDAQQVLTEGVEPSGMAVGFKRLWLISGGYPFLVSAPLKQLTQNPIGWEGIVKEEDKG
jgi:BarA-like signal transduction histidine kinase